MTYSDVRKRYSIGRKEPLSDAEIITAQESEIERYREEIRSLREKLHNVAEPEPWGFGDICKAKFDGEIVAFTPYSVKKTVSLDRLSTVKIFGTIVK